MILALRTPSSVARRKLAFRPRHESGDDDPFENKYRGPATRLPGLWKGVSPLRCRRSAPGWRQESELLFNRPAISMDVYIRGKGVIGYVWSSTTDFHRLLEIRQSGFLFYFDVLINSQGALSIRMILQKLRR